MKIFCSRHNGKNGSAAAYSLLAYALRAAYGMELPEIKKTSNGKPYFPERPEIHFSLSHAKTHVLCAISGAPVGADVESPRQISGRAIKYFCSAEELYLFDALDLWVLKESYIKLVGGTLPMVKNLRFSREGDKIVAPGINAASRLYSVDGCRAAVSSFQTFPPDQIIAVENP